MVHMLIDPVLDWLSKIRLGNRLARKDSYGVKHGAPCVPWKQKPYANIHTSLYTNFKTLV